MRAAIYARVSSERQEKEHTIGSQLEALRNYAAQNGMEIIEEFTDEGYSGARLDRPALDRMRDLAERRGFEVLLTYCTDRLARKFVLQALILEEMERFGVKTIFLEGGAADDPLSKLMHQITGAVAEFERAKIVERNRRGKLYRARCGEVVTWRAPFGYVRIPRRDGVAPHVEIDENKAVVVRRIFDLYAKQGGTVRQIAKQLTLQGTPAPGGGREWNFYTVDRILHNEAYVGTLYYNRHNCAAMEGTYGQKRPSCQRILRPKEEWIPISIPPIIDLETFHQAGIRVKDNQRFSPRNLQEDAYLLRRLVRCGHCGLSCRVSSNTANPNCSHYYVCPGTKKYFLIAKRCSQRCIGADALDELVWQEVSTRLQDPDLVLEAYRECRIHRRNGEEAGLSEQGQKLATQIKLANTEMTRLLDAYQAGAIELPELQKRRRLVDAKLDTLHREKELLEKMAREQKQERDVRRDLEEFRALVSNRVQHSSFEGKQKLMRMVLDKVVVRDWQVDVHYNIPLSRPAAPREEKVSTNFDLCNARHASTEGYLPKLGYSVWRSASLLAAPSCRMAWENHRSQCSPAGGTLLPAARRAAFLAPTSQERAAGRRPEAQGREVTSPDTFHRPHSVGSVGCTSTNTASLPHQEATVELQWSSVGDTQQRGISHRGRAAQALEEGLRRSWAEQKP
jgi:site-specific DNA recombinase